VLLWVGLFAACDVNAALEQLLEARRLSADLLVQFTKAADAANRAVMADTDESSVAFAHEAQQAKQVVETDVSALRPILEHLKYEDESHLLGEFAGRFKTYNDLDERILDLAVQNTNLKAERLSFGPAQDAADKFRDSTQVAVRSASPAAHWEAEALAASAVSSVREIQALEAPHIADADDADMGRLEARMSGAETAARQALTSLGTVAPSGRTQLAAAEAALDTFMALHNQVLALSHRNTNVRSLALSLDQKRPLVTSCEESLRALQAALAKRGYTVRQYWK
jgi:rhodanese-related sulfurtransferase